MCTVTYIPSANGYYLTSNRDEKITRKTAILPAEYINGDMKLIYPKDADAGGTWIVLKENGDSLCLLNGAFENFVDTGKFTFSRGKIVLQIATAYNMATAFKEIDCCETAPFTLIIVNESKLFECRWDGQQKFCKMLNDAQPHIWSSATLYDKTQRQLRTDWFSAWLKNITSPSWYDIYNFHKKTGDGNIEHDLIMNRGDKLFTVSITGIAVQPAACLMQYNDLKNCKNVTTAFSYQAAVI